MRCYTLECNYNTGKVTTTLPSPARAGKQEARFNEHVFNKQAIMAKNLDCKYSSEPYSILTFESVGFSMLEALVEARGGHGSGRLRASIFSNLTNLRLNIAVSVLRTLPFRNYPRLRKLNDKISFGEKQQQAFREVYEMLDLAPEELLPVRPLVIKPGRGSEVRSTRRGRSVNPTL
jgi:hypothetical protein